VAVAVVAGKDDGPSAGFDVAYRGADEVAFDPYWAVTY